MADNLEKIQRFVVLMMENRSFDHLLGYLKTVNPAVYGLTIPMSRKFSRPPDAAATRLASGAHRRICDAV